jgi:subtilisin family serine protease
MTTPPLSYPGVYIQPTKLALQLTRLDRVMSQCTGHPSIVIGVLDGPVANHPDLRGLGSDTETASTASLHGTMVTGVLAAQRGSAAPGICPSCRLVVRPIFEDDGMPNTNPAIVADQIVDCVDAGARLLNMSAAYASSSGVGDNRLTAALDYASTRGAIVIVAAGNYGRIAGSPLVSHESVVPVASCDESGQPMPSSNLGASIGRRGVLAPGFGITSLAPGGGLGVLNGTSAATTLVTGAIALAWSAAPFAPVAVVRRALQGWRVRRAIVPPLLDAWTLYETVTRRHQEMLA